VTELIPLAVRFLLAALFLLAGLSKLARLGEFESTLRRYELLPRALVGATARLLPAVEVACALLLGVGLATRVVALALAGLLIIFATAVAINLLRGREIDCGCFSAAAPNRITWRTVVRNVVLSALALVVVARPPAALALDGLWLARETSVPAGSALAVLVTSTVGLASFGVLLELWRFNRFARLAPTHGATG